MSIYFCTKCHIYLGGSTLRVKNKSIDIDFLALFLWPTKSIYFFLEIHTFVLTNTFFYIQGNKCYQLYCLSDDIKLTPSALGLLPSENEVPVIIFTSVLLYYMQLLLSIFTIIILLLY